MSDVVKEHRESSPTVVRLAVITVSDTRTPENDTGGNTIVELAAAAGHTISVRQIIPDDPHLLRPVILAAAGNKEVDAVLLTGGTGLSSRDHTADVVKEVLTHELVGYGELFRMLSYQEIGSAAMLSRAVGGLIGVVPVLAMPGSPNAVKLAMQKLILPELGHLLREARR